MNPHRAFLTIFLKRYCDYLDSGLSPGQAIDEFSKDTDVQFKPAFDRFFENIKSEKSLDESLRLLGRSLGTQEAEAICLAMVLHRYFGTSTTALKEFIGIQNWS